MSDQFLSEENLDSTAQASPLESFKGFLNRQPRWLIGLGAVGLLLVVGAPIVQSQMAAQSTEATEETRAEVLAVETLTVNAVDSYEVSRSYTGEIAALRSSDLGFNRGGELVQVLVAEGDRVTSG